MPTLDIQISAGDRDASERDDGSNFSDSGVTDDARANSAASLRTNAGYIWPIPIPAGSTIDVAHIVFELTTTAGDDASLSIHYESIDSAPDFTTNPDVTSRTRSGSSVSWSATGLGTGPVNSPSIVSLVQEFIDRGGYVSGNLFCALLIGDSSGSAALRIESYDGNPGTAATLHLEYTEPTPPPTPGEGARVAPVPGPESQPALSFRLNNPLISGGAPLYTFSPDSITYYEQKKRADGGNYSGKAIIQVTREEAEDFLENGLMRHFQAIDESGVEAFSGFVNLIKVQVGSLSAVRGPAMGITNKARLIYAPLDTSIDPPIVGSQTISDWSEKASSQSRYGIMEGVLSIGEMLEENIAGLLSAYLAQFAEPVTSESLTLDERSGGISVEIEILGYIHLLEKYTYANAGSGTEAASVKIAAILAANPNGIFATKNKISTNSVNVAVYSLGDLMAAAVLWDIVKLGGSSGERFILGMGRNQVVTYEAVPTLPTYEHDLASGRQAITKGKTIVQPWNVEPGKWLFIRNFLPGLSQAVPLAEDPRMLFIEEVTYQSAYGLQVNGGDVQDINRAIGKYTQTGVAT